ERHDGLVVDQYSRKRTRETDQERIARADSQHESQHQPRSRIPDHSAQVRDYDDFRSVEQKKHQHERNGKKSVAEDCALVRHVSVSLDYSLGAVSSREQFETRGATQGRYTADTDGETHFCSARRNRFFGDGMARPFSYFLQILDRAVREDGKKFLAAVAPNKIVLPHGLVDAASTFLEDGVTSQMTESVVNALEVIEINHQNPGWGAGTEA